MPRGTRHQLIGLLLEHHGSLLLHVEDGGTWQLDVGRGARRLLGERARVEGIRDGFDLLAVEKIDRV